MPTYIGEGGGYVGTLLIRDRDLIDRTLPPAILTQVAYLVDTFGSWDSIADVDVNRSITGQAAHGNGYFETDGLGATLNTGLSVSLPTATFTASYQAGDVLDINGRHYSVFAVDTFNAGAWVLLQIDPA